MKKARLDPSLPVGGARSIYVDVDGCLLKWPGPKPGRVPRRGEPHHGEPPTVNWLLVDVLKEWRRQFPDGFLVVWSRGGVDHVEMAVELAQIESLVDACLEKPRCMIDDSFGWLKRGTTRRGPDLSIVEQG